MEIWEKRRKVRNRRVKSEAEEANKKNELRCNSSMRLTETGRGSSPDKQSSSNYTIDPI